MRIRLKDIVIAGAVTALGAFIADDWIGGASAAVLWFIWTYLRDEGGVPVIAAALTFQWMQVTIGLWYYGVTGRQLDTMALSDYRPMILIGLGCVLALALGIRAGISFLERRARSTEASAEPLPISWPQLIAGYIVATASEAAVNRIAFEFPALTQPILALAFIRLGIVFLIMRRLTSPVLQLRWVALFVCLEVLLGITGFFAGFREPLVMTAMAIYQAFDVRKVQHWALAILLSVLMVGLSTMWMSVRRDYRASFEDEKFAGSRQVQMDKMRELATSWWRDEHDAGEVDRLVDRLWTIYYPALAVSRVPSVLPHTDGALMSAALQHVFSPRVFFPNKAPLQSDSDMVRKYTGLYVAGVEQNTSIAFGYAAECYIDFGVPWMFVPILIYGFAIGLAYAYLVRHISHADLRAGLLVVVFWLTLYLFERSWVKTLGLGGTLLVYLGAPALLVDYYLSRGERRVRHVETYADGDSWQAPSSL